MFYFFVCFVLSCFFFVFFFFNFLTIKDEEGMGKISSSIPRDGRALTMAQLLQTEEASSQLMESNLASTHSFLHPFTAVPPACVFQGWLGLQRRCSSATP